MAVSRPTEPGQSHQTQKINVLQRHIWQAVYGRLHFPSQSDHLYIREGTFPSQIHLTFSNPPQLHCNSSMLLKSFSKRKPSQCLLKSKCWKIFNLLKWKYLLSSFSNGVYVLHQKKPSQILLNGNTFSAPSQMKYMFYISSYDLL